MNVWTLVETKMRACQKILGVSTCNELARCVMTGDAARFQDLVAGPNGRSCAELAMLLAQLQKDQRAVDMVRAACKKGWLSPHSAGLCVAVAQRDTAQIAAFRGRGGNGRTLTQAIVDTKQATMMDAVGARSSAIWRSKLKSSL